MRPLIRGHVAGAWVGDGRAEGVRVWAAICKSGALGAMSENLRRRWVAYPRALTYRTLRRRGRSALWPRTRVKAVKARTDERARKVCEDCVENGSVNGTNAVGFKFLRLKPWTCFGNRRAT